MEYPIFLTTTSRSVGNEEAINLTVFSFLFFGLSK